MSQNGGAAPKASPPGRPRHQITRSISELSSPKRLHRHHSHRAARETERDARIPAPLSGIPVVQARRSFEWSRSEGVTPNLTPNASRRTSILYASADEVMPVVKAQKDDISGDGLAKEQQKAVARQNGLQRSLAELESYASSTTKQLDETYESVLDKLRALQNTVAALKELADLSHQLNSGFSTDADELVADVGSQLDAFGQFEHQKKRIESLQDRIQAGRKLIRSLSERVDAVSERIESWERADREWQEKTRRRLKTVWIVTSVAVFLVLSLFLGSQYASEGLEETTARIATDGFNTLRDVAAAKADLLWSSRVTGPRETGESRNGTETLGGGTSATTDMLEMFDEL